MHIGGLRTVLFDYFLARQNNGQFILRIEDTDQERLVPGAIEYIFKMLKAFDITPDEGPTMQADGSIVEVGDYGPYIQSNRLDIYKKHADILMEKGVAYPCFCSIERLDEMRKAQIAIKQTTKYDRKCLGLNRSIVEEKIKAGESYVIRMKVPEGSTTFDDAIRGTITFDNSEVDDCVLMKSDGFPTYYLAVVIDDHLMNITHILRGEEWISSTPKSLLLFAMFGWESPIFAHVPLLLGADKKKLSKRTGDTAVDEYLKHGYLVETLINFVGTLGFNPSADREIFSITELIEKFDLSKVNSSGAVLNMDKLDWMNKHYLMQLSINDLANRAKEFIASDISNERVRRALFVERSRVSRLTDFDAAIAPYLVLPAYDKSIVIWKKADDKDAIDQLTNIEYLITNTAESIFEDIALLESTIKEYIAYKGLQNGNVLWPLRVSLSGLEKSATPFELLWALGKEESIRRINFSIDQFKI